MIAELHWLASLPESHRIQRSLRRHALVETRHFLGLYRRRVQDRQSVKAVFLSRIAWGELWRGIRSASDLCFFIKLVATLR